MMKPACVTAVIVTGKAPGAANIRYIRNTSNTASVHSGCNLSGRREFWRINLSQNACLKLLSNVPCLAF